MTWTAANPAPLCRWPCELRLRGGRPCAAGQCSQEPQPLGRVFACYLISGTLGGMKKTVERAPAPEGSLRAALATLPDVRRGQGRVHPLDGMLALAVCALLCGCRSLYAIGQWGQDCGPESRLALGLRRDRGPSVATLHRAFRRLDHAAFEQVLGEWVAAQGLRPD